MGGPASEERQQAALGVVALLAVLGVVWLAAETFLGGDDVRDAAEESPSSSKPSRPPSPVSTPSTTAPSAAFHLTVEDGCRALTASGDLARVPAASARSDNAWMARRFGDGYRGVGIGRCDRSPVLVVGVASPLVDVPVAGPRGTSVIVYWQPPIVAFGE